MDNLKFRIVENEKDREKVYDLALHVNSGGNHDYARFLSSEGSGRHSAIVYSGERPIGFWHGLTNGELPVPDGIKSPTFHMTLIFLLGEFRGEGAGELIERHQLQFAKDMGCRSFYCEIDVGNERGLNLQKKLGATCREGRYDDYQCYFDLDKLDF